MLPPFCLIVKHFLKETLDLQKTESLNSFQGLNKTNTYRDMPNQIQNNICRTSKMQIYLHTTTSNETLSLTGGLYVFLIIIYGIVFEKFWIMLTITYFHLANARLSSAWVHFTSEFGMGSGGTRLLFSSMGIWYASKIRCQWCF